MHPWLVARWGFPRFKTIHNFIWRNIDYLRDGLGFDTLSHINKNLRTKHASCTFKVPMFIHRTWSKYHVLFLCLSLQPQVTGVGVFVLLEGRHSISCGQLSHTQKQSEYVPHGIALKRMCVCVCGVRNVITQYWFMGSDVFIQLLHLTSDEASYTSDVAHQYVGRLQHMHFRARCSYSLWSLT